MLLPALLPALLLLLQSSLIVAILLEERNDNVCQAGLYGELVPLLKLFSPAQQYCAYVYPQKCGARNMKRVAPSTTLKISATLAAPSTTPKTSTTSSKTTSTRNPKESAWSKFLQQGREAVSTLCSCIQPSCTTTRMTTPSTTSKYVLPTTESKSSATSSTTQSTTPSTTPSTTTTTTTTTTSSTTTVSTTSANPSCTALSNPYTSPSGRQYSLKCGQAPNSYSYFQTTAPNFQNCVDQCGVTPIPNGQTCIGVFYYGDSTRECDLVVSVSGGYSNFAPGYDSAVLII